MRNAEAHVATPRARRPLRPAAVSSAREDTVLWPTFIVNANDFVAFSRSKYSGDRWSQPTLMPSKNTLFGCHRKRRISIEGALSQEW